VGELSYDTSLLRGLWLVLQVAMWTAALMVAARVRVSLRRPGSPAPIDEPLIDLTGDPVPTLLDPGLAASVATRSTVVEPTAPPSAEVPESDPIDPEAAV